MPSLIVRLDTADNIVIAVDEIAAGVVIPSEGISTRDLIPAGHKLATSIIRAGEPILKYNTVIGYAADNIPAGSHVHSHNIQLDNVEKNYA